MKNYLMSKKVDLVFVGLLTVGALLPLSASCDAVPVPAESANPLAHLGGISQQPGGIMAFAPFLLMFAVLYFLVLRPQQKKVKEQQQLLLSLKQGDEIVTASGILGKITGITDKVVTLEVAEGVRIKLFKSQVSQVVKGSVKDISL